MDTKCFQVAGLAVKVVGRVPFSFFDTFFNFESEAVYSDNALNITFIPKRVLTAPKELAIRDGCCQWLLPKERSSHKATAYIRRETNQGDRGYLVIHAENNWSDVSIIYDEDGYTGGELAGFAGVAYRNRILFSEGLVIHASVIVKNGKAIIFTAPSGGGKSTQTKLWRDFREARILNDDCPCLKVKNNNVIAYGTPWSGTGNYYINDSASVAAIVVVEKSLKNSIKQLRQANATASVLPRFFLPYQDEEMMDKALAISSHIVASVPVFRLQCRPDEGAVELVEQCLGL